MSRLNASRSLSTPASNAETVGYHNCRTPHFMVRKVDGTLYGLTVKIGPSRREQPLHSRAKKLGTVSAEKCDRHSSFLVARYAFLPRRGSSAASLRRQSALSARKYRSCRRRR